MESVPEEVWHNGCAVRPVQAEQSGVKTRKTQHFRQKWGEGGAAQVEKQKDFETFLPVTEKSNFDIRMPFLDFLSINNFFNNCIFFLNLCEWKKDDCTLKGRAECVQFIWLFIGTNANRSQNQNVKLTNSTIECTKRKNKPYTHKKLSIFFFYQICMHWTFPKTYRMTHSCWCWDWGLILTCIYWYFCRYLKDFFISMIDMSWSLTLCSFAASFFISWLLFAVIWYFVVLHHGELNIKEIFFLMLESIFNSSKCNKNKLCLVLDAWCAMFCILSAHIEGQKLITANFFA